MLLAPHPAYWANPNYVFVVTPDGFSQPSPHRALKTSEIPGIIEQYRIAAVNERNAEKLERQKWRVITLWECQVVGDQARFADFFAREILSGFS